MSFKRLAIELAYKNETVNFHDLKLHEKNLLAAEFFMELDSTTRAEYFVGGDFDTAGVNLIIQHLLGNSSEFFVGNFFINNLLEHMEQKIINRFNDVVDDGLKDRFEEAAYEAGRPLSSVIHHYRRIAEGG